MLSTLLLILSLSVSSQDSLTVKSRAVEDMMSEVLDSLRASGRYEDIVLHPTSLGMKIVDKARDYIGCRYGAGQMGPKRFDCSGFTSYIYLQFGITLGRSSRDQFLDGDAITDTRGLMPGDLVFFSGTRASDRIGHVGIVTEADPETGCFRFIHAAMTGIQIDRSDADFYQKRYIGARRIVN